MKQPILLVGCDPHLAESFEGGAVKPLTVDSLSSAEELLAEVAPAAIMVVQCSAQGACAQTLVDEVLERFPGTMPIVLCAELKAESLLRYRHDGRAFQLLRSPCPDELVVSAVRNALLLLRSTSSSPSLHSAA